MSRANGCVIALRPLEAQHGITHRSVDFASLLRGDFESETMLDYFFVYMMEGLRVEGCKM